VGDWRLGLFNDWHFVISRGTAVSQLFVWDGKLYSGSKYNGFNLNNRPLATGTLSPEEHGIVFGDNYIEFHSEIVAVTDPSLEESRKRESVGKWFRMSVVKDHLSIHTSKGVTAMIWSPDGVQHPRGGIATDFQTSHSKATSEAREAMPRGISFGPGNVL